MRRPKPNDVDAAQIEFWQDESHYFEERARTQGANATQMVTISIATLVLGAVPIAIDLGGTSAGSRGSWDPELTSWFLLAVPAIALLLWMTALRFITEMNRLVAYYDHADQQVALLYGTKGWSGRYTSWKAVGGRSPALSPGNIAWFVIAGVVQLGAASVYLAMFVAREWPSIVSNWVSVVVACVVVLTALVAIGIIIWECLRAGPLTERELATDPSGSPPTALAGSPRLG